MIHLFLSIYHRLSSREVFSSFSYSSAHCNTKQLAHGQVLGHRGHGAKPPLGVIGERPLRVFLLPFLPQQAIWLHAVHNVDLLFGKVLEPAGHVMVVDGTLQKRVPDIDATLGGEEQLLEAWIGLALVEMMRAELVVVGDESLHRVSEDQEQL
jgi:hypothetical protein